VEAICARHVRAVLVEKPIANNLETALRVSDAFKTAGTLVSVGFMCRYRASVARAKQLMEAGDPTVLVNGWWVDEMPPPLWWRTMSASGGQFVEQCTHLVDLARYLVGEIDEVSAYATRGFILDVPDYTVDDAMVVNVRFRSGAIGNFSTGCFVREGHASGMGIGLTLASRSAKCVFTSWNVDLTLISKGAQEEVRSTESDIFAVQNAVFLDAVRTDDTSNIRSSYEDAIKTLKVGLAAMRSAQERRVVKLSELSV
jgi:predicted dehydrogenase